MTEPVSVDCIVLGAGIAGMSCGDALIQHQKSCVILDPAEPGNGSSSAPGMLINPATGRRAKMAWRASHCFDAISDLIERVQQHSNTKFYEEKGIIRPALTRKLAKNFSRSPEKYNWPDNWIQWFPSDSFSERFPIFQAHHGGLLVKRGMTVIGNQFIKSFAKAVVKMGANMQIGDYKLMQEKGFWIAETEHGKRYRSKHVIDATGYQQQKSEFWSFLPLHVIKGQTATFFFEEPIPLQTSVSSLGYMAYLNGLPDRMTVGSTYEHEFSGLEPDEKGLLYLKKKLESTFPGLTEKITDVKQWSGVRVTVPDKKPVIGLHPELEGLYIMGALGSKGLLMGRYLAELLVNEIFTQQEAHQIVSIRRFLSTGN